MDIQNLIAAKRKQIAVLERHIQMLEQMALEEGRFSRDSSASPATAAASRSTGTRTRGGRHGASYVEMIAAYLKSHPGRQRATEIAAALGLSASQVHGAIRNGVTFGRFKRGRKRGTIALAPEGTAARTRPGKPKRRRRARSRGRATKAPTAAASGQAPA